MEIGTIVDEDTYNTQYQPKYTYMETKPEEKEEQMEKADQVYKRALRDQAPDPPPPPVDGGGARAPFIPKIEMKLAPDLLTDEIRPLEYNAWVEKCDFHFKMSGMANQDEKLIIALLKTVVSDQISVRCDMEAATDMVGALARIDKDYSNSNWDNHPIITMRLTYAKMK